MEESAHMGGLQRQEVHDGPHTAAPRSGQRTEHGLLDTHRNSHGRQPSQRSRRTTSGARRSQGRDRVVRRHAEHPHRRREGARSGQGTGAAIAKAQAAAQAAMEAAPAAIDPAAAPQPTPPIPRWRWGQPPRRRAHTAGRGRSPRSRPRSPPCPPRHIRDTPAAISLHSGITTEAFR